MIRLAGPLAAANLLQMLVYAIDVIFIARLGTEALAASSLSVSVFMLLTWGLSSVAGGAAPIMAAELGRRRHAVREVRRSVRMALWLSLLFGVIVIVVLHNGGAVLAATGQNPAIIARAAPFMAIIGWAGLPMIAATVLRVFVSTLGRPVFATAITGLAILVNAAGNYALVFGNWGAPALGLEGSALASVITSFATFAAYALAILGDRRLRRYHIWGRFWRPEWSRLAEIVSIGTPIALTVVAEGGLFGSAAFLMGRIGARELAAHTVALQLAPIAFQVPFGLGQAATIRVGYAYGARDAGAVARAGVAALTSCVLFAVLNAGLMLLVPRTLLALYVDVSSPANAALVRTAAGFLAIAAAFQLADSAQTVLAGALRGLQDTRVPMAIALAGYWLPGFGTAVALGFFTPLGGSGVWIGLAVGLLVVATCLLWRWLGRERLGLLPREPAMAPA